MPKVLYCNSFEVTSTKEAFMIILRFESPDGYRETVYVAIGPAGAVVLNETLGNAIAEYAKKHGDIVVDAWKTQKPNKSNDAKDVKYLS